MSHAKVDSLISKFHFLTIQLSDETVNLVVEISGVKLRELANVDATVKEKGQSVMAYELACAILAKSQKINGARQVYNREITRANFDADYGSHVVLPDGCKGWIVKPRKLPR